MTAIASKHAASGEYLVLSELLKCSQEAYLAQGAVQPDWDILCIDNKKIIRIQVKTIDWPNQKSVNVKDDSEYDYLVVVLLNREGESSGIYVFSKEQFEPMLSKRNKNRKDKKRTVNFNNDAKEKFKAFYKKWWF